MILIFFITGLAYFSLSLVVFLEARRASQLPLGRQLPWLAAFGLTHSLVEWSDMIILIGQSEAYACTLTIIRSILLPISAALLVRFGVGLVQEAGPLPYHWLTWAPVLLIIPVGLLLGYVLTVFHTEPPAEVATDVWSRYLIYFPGNLLASFGFLRQFHGLKLERLKSSRNLLLSAALAFFVNAFVAGLIAPPVSYGFGPWLNYQWVIDVTGVPVQIWRSISAFFVTFFVVKSLDVFEAERSLRLSELEEAQKRTQQDIVDALSLARATAEEWTNALVKISRCIIEMDDPVQALRTILRTGQQLLNADVAVLGLWSEDGEKLQIKYRAAKNDPNDEVIDENFQIDPLIVDTMRETVTRRYPEDYPPRKEPLFFYRIDHEIKNALMVPLKLENQPFGGIWVGRLEAIGFTETEQIGLESLADQAAIAITHATMASRLQSLAVLEERGRIGREMHDSLAQVLGYLRLETQTLEALVQQNNQDMVLKKLNQFRQNIDTAHADVRENILSLRTALSNQGGTIPGLQEYLTEFGLQTGIRTIFENTLTGELDLSPIAETQMVRIVQEALANIRKHAQAKNVVVKLTALPSYLSVKIMDDGIGFDQKVDRKRFGLQTMRERAESAGGSLSIDTSPGKGTQVDLRLPLVVRHGA